MRTSVLVTNYNYAEYVCDAVRSILKQTLPPNEIIVVDDGSSDDSFDRLRQEFGSEPSVHLIRKDNGGQLSAFNFAYQMATGDLIFFLDSDDLYKETYIEKAVSFYDSQCECDFLYCAIEEFGSSDEVVRDYERDTDLGFSVVSTIETSAWIGGRTSSLSMRKSILDRFMPIPLEQDWRVRADDCLVFGTSIAGAHKFFLAEPLVRYRVHGDNAWYGKKLNKHEGYHYQLKINTLIAHFLKLFGYNRPALADLIVREFTSTKDARNYKEFRRYQKVIRKSHRVWRWQRAQQRGLKKAYRKMRKNG